MATVPLIPYDEAKPEARAVYDNIMQTRKINDVNNFWKALAHSPDLLKHVWERAQEVMKPGALDAVTKELIYIAVSLTADEEANMTQVIVISTFRRPAVLVPWSTQEISRLEQL